jgi:polyferredoxin
MDSLWRNPPLIRKLTRIVGIICLSIAVLLLLFYELKVPGFYYPIVGFFTGITFFLGLIFFLFSFLYRKQ